MLTLQTTAQFRKDYKRSKRRGYRMELLEAVIQALIEEQILDARYRDHALGGTWEAYRECHILPD